MFFMTLVPFLPFSRSAAARFTIITTITPTRRRCSTGCNNSAWSRRPARHASGGILETLGYIVHGDRADLANSNVADVFNSIINMLGTGITIIVILLSPPLAQKFGKKAVAVAGFALATVGSLAFYLLSPTNVNGMVALTAFVAIVYAPTIPLIWAIFADVADYSEWKTGRRFTGMVFATIGFALKSGLALGSASFLWIMKCAVQLRHQAARRASSSARLPRVQRDRGRHPLRRLHRPVDRLPAQQAHDHPDGRRTGRAPEKFKHSNSIA